MNPKADTLWPSEASVTGKVAVIPWYLVTTPIVNCGFTGVAIVRLYVLLAVREWLSVTVTITVNGLPTLVAGVPEMTPVVGAMLNPLGRPVADQV